MHSKAKAVSITGILAALSAILYVWPHMSIFPVPFHIFKLDFADIPALLAGSIVSPVSGLIVVLIRCAIHLPLSDTMFVGELSNFVISGAFVFVASAFMPKKPSSTLVRIGKTTGNMIFCSIFHVILAAAVNFYITLPLYKVLMGVSEEMFGGMRNYIVAGVVPFNAIKAAANSLIFLVVYNALIPKIRRFI